MGYYFRKVSEVIEYTANNMLSPMIHMYALFLTDSKGLLTCVCFLFIQLKPYSIVSCEPVGSHDVRA